MNRTFWKTACAVAVGMAFALPAFGADFNFKFAHSQPATSVRHKSMELFKDKLEKASKRPHHGGALCRQHSRQ